MPGDYSEELVELGARMLAEFRYGADEHAPWSYTEFGVLCNCGEAIIRDDMCAGHWDYMSGEAKDGYRAEARAILDALSSSGRLVPEGSEVREEWTMRYDLNGKPECAEDNGHVFDSRDEAVRHIKAWRRFFPGLTYSDVEYLRRDAITTPWTPSEPAQEER